MSSLPTPPPLPPRDPAPPSGQWAYPVDERGEPKKKYVLWLALGAAGCLGSLLLVGLAATLLVPWLARRYSKSVQAKMQAELQMMRLTLDSWVQEHGGQFPDSLEALVQPDAQGHTPLANLRELPRDPWDRAYLYDPPNAEHDRPRIYSLGRDGQPGGEGLDEDVYDDTEEREGR